jgi:hypothetical protein
MFRHILSWHYQPYSRPSAVPAKKRNGMKYQIYETEGQSDGRKPDNITRSTDNRVDMKIAKAPLSRKIC